MEKHENQTLFALIFMMVIAVGLFQPHLLKAAISSSNYDFGPVEVESTKTTAIRIENLENAPTTITGLDFANMDCSDFTVVSTPASMSIPANGTIEVEIGFTPLAIGSCTDTLRIYNGTPMPFLVSLTGTGVAPQSEQPKPDDMGQFYLAQIEEIKAFMQTSIDAGTLEGTGNGKQAGTRRLKTLNTMLIETSHLVENGRFEAARNKLTVIHKKADGKPSPQDFVTGANTPELASKISKLIADFDFE